MSAPRFTRVVAVAVGVGLSSGCMVGPNYKRPEMTIPENHRGVAGPPSEASIADAPWWEVFGDTALQTLIREAVAANLDLQVAAARVLEARAQAGIAKSFLYPSIGASGGYTARQLPRLSDPPQADLDKTTQNWDISVGLSWEIDLWGRVRRESQAAVARYVATEEGRRGVLISLVAEIASSYFSLRELDLELEIARRTLTLNDETITFYTRRLEGGVSNRLELDQAQANRAVTAATIPDIERRIVLTENALSVLLGRVPGPIARGRTLAAQDLPPRVPAGIPAALLERRPDVLAAERQLIAANADIGAAKALFFPTISLSGAFGGLTRDLSDIAKADSIVWSLGAGIFQPIFQGGRIRRNYEAAQARFQAALAQYKKAALNGYREVADSLTTIEKLAQSRVEQEKGVEALRDAATLSRSRYDAGLSNYLEILVADQALFQQELSLARTRGGELQAFSQLYRALGGGWQPEENPERTSSAVSTPP